MKVLNLTINGFRGINEASINFNNHSVLIRPISVGKSTIMDALALVLGSSRHLKPLSEHDFYGSNPGPESRIQIVATIGGFANNDPGDHEDWFRERRAVHKWWNPITYTISSLSSEHNNVLCAQVAFAARFDKQELDIETMRYFYDDFEVTDPFIEDVVVQIPNRLLNDVGFFILPTIRTSDKAFSLGSELFRRVITRLGGIPADQLLEERDRLRNPEHPIEENAAIRSTVDRISTQLSNLLPNELRLQLRINGTDSQSLLQSLVPHYSNGVVSLPAWRHGTGLLSLQSFLMVFEIGRNRLEQEKNFILAVEEPEIHLPHGIQRRLIYTAQSAATQTICTSHSATVASFYSPSNIIVLENNEGRLSSKPLLESSLTDNAPNGLRKLFLDNRNKLIEALMQYRVLIPDGPTEYEWFRLLVQITETAEYSDLGRAELAFGSYVGVIPTHDAAIIDTAQAVGRVRSGIIALVDGDGAGDAYKNGLVLLTNPPVAVIQWPDGWFIEHAIKWILEVEETQVLAKVNPLLQNPITTMDEFLHVLTTYKDGGIKGNYLMYEEVSGIIRDLPQCLRRTEHLLSVLCKICLDSDQNLGNVQFGEEVTESFRVVRCP